MRSTAKAASPFSRWMARRIRSLSPDYEKRKEHDHGKEKKKKC